MGWVRRIMVTTSLDKYRNNHKLVRVEEIKKTDTPVEENLALSEIPVEEMINLIRELPPRYRMVFNMFVMEGYNHLEISKELGISEGASKSNLSRAREILRNKLQFQYSEIRKNRRYSL
jgi:RNA polymerase sigma-70 factor (ECF subfamily)